MTNQPRRRRVGQAPTIYDVARQSGVALSTVSRAFSRPGRVKAETASGSERRPPAWVTRPTRRLGPCRPGAAQWSHSSSPT